MSTEVPSPSNINPNSLPHRFRESSFNVYQDLIRAAVESHPQQFRIRCALYNLSPCTMSNRMRDAMKSLFTYKWQTPSWNEHTRKRFFELYAADELKVSESSVEASVIVSPRAALSVNRPTLEALNLGHVATGGKTNITAIDLASLTSQELIATLAAQRLLACPILCSGVSDSDIVDLESRFDVAISPAPNGNVTII